MPNAAADLHDLSPIFTPATADMIRDAWICARDGTDPQPIREHYRAMRHAGFRGVIAEIMSTAGATYS